MNTAIFLLSIVLTAAVVYFIFRNLKNPAKKGALFKYLIPAGILILWLLTAVYNLIPNDAEAYRSTYLFMAAVSTASYLIGIYGKKSYRKEMLFAVRIILIASVLELTVFNLPSYKLMFSEYPQMTLAADDIRIVKGGTRNSNNTMTALTNGELVTEIKDLNIPIGTVYADIEIKSDEIKSVPFYIDVKDSTQATDYRYNILKTEIIKDCKDTNYALCDFSGKVSDIRLKLNTPDNTIVYVKSFTFNRPLPFSINYTRFLLITVLGTFIYCVLFSSIFAGTVTESRTLCSFLAFAVTVYTCLCAYSIIEYKIYPSTLPDEIKKDSGNQVTQELVDAFEAGRFSLLEEPDSFLEELNNPYDTVERNDTGKYYQWDHVYYNGHYYSYYGITPVILLFLPYHVITGYYFSNSAAILLFAMIGIIGLTMLYMTFVRKWFPNMPSGIVIICLIIIQISSGVWYSLGRAEFYEIALSCGFAFITWGIFFLLKSNILGKGKISLLNSALASLFLALAVLSRPTLALYCICAAVFMILAVPKAASEMESKKKDKKKKKQVIFNSYSVKYILCAFLPMVCLGMVQMFYNYKRFNSPFDFGIQYSLTINDFTNSQFHLKFSLMAIYNYLLNFPVFMAEYPFVKSSFQYMNTGGYFYVDTFSTLNSSGLFMLVPPMFFYFFAHRALREMPDRKTKILSAARIGIPCLLVPVIIIASVWESGYAVRYMADFSIEAILGAYVIMFFIFSSTKNETVRKLIKYFTCFSLVWVSYTEVIQIINQAFRYQEFTYSYPEIAHKMEQIIAFWK